ncbi:MAG: IS110 family transposase [Verrucomicrobiota bacterium]
MKTKELSDSWTSGLDRGDMKHAVCVLDGEGTIIDERAITSYRESLRRLGKKYPGARVALEVGMNIPWTSRFLKDLGLEVIVADARKLRAIYLIDRNSDELDARLLAKLARVEPSLLYPIEHGSEQAQRDLLQIKLRDNLVRQQVDIISSVRSALKSLGIRLPSPNTKCFAKQARALLGGEHAELLAMIEPSLGVIDELTLRIGELDWAIEALCQERYPETARLRQIRGVGPITALCFVLVVGHPDRFEQVREVAAYLGLVPKRDQSGGVDKKLSISKAGNAYMRRLLVGSAQYILGPFGEDCELRRQRLRLIERGGRGAKKKAVVATARKLSVEMLAMG